jgi:hypothetical protein
MDREPQNGNIVATLLKDGRQLIKRFRELPENLIQLYSDNPNMG